MLHFDEGNPTPAPIAALYDYFEAAARTSTRYESPSVSSDSAAIARNLSPVERATARITLGPPVDGIGVIYEAVARLRVLDARGVLSRLSAHTVAQTLQIALHSAHPRGLRHANKGWRTLELADSLNLIEVWLDTPRPGSPRQFRRVRLCERMNEIHRPKVKCPQ